MQTYIFTVAVNGDDVQDAAEQFREAVIEAWNGAQAGTWGEADVHVTESVRVSTEPPLTGYVGPPLADQPDADA